MRPVSRGVMAGVATRIATLLAGAALAACSADRHLSLAPDQAGPDATVAAETSESIVADDYEVQLFSALGGTHTYVKGIDNTGGMAGYANEAGGGQNDWRPFARRRDVVHRLRTLGGASGRVLAVAPHGAMTGLSARASGRSAFSLWDNDVITDLSATYPEMSVPHGIGRNGHIVGRCGVGSSPLYACMAAIGITFTLEPPRSGVRSEAYAVNASGVAVGELIDATGLHAMLWRGSHSVVLPGLSTTFSRARSINDRGEVVGESIKPPYRFRHAVLWREGTPVVDLGTAGGLESMAYDINDAGVVVGAAIRQHGNARPFVWRNGRMRLLPLPDLPIEWSEATAINDRGEIVGFAALGNFAQVLGVAWKPR